MVKSQVCRSRLSSKFTRLFAKPMNVSCTTSSTDAWSLSRRRTYAVEPAAIAPVELGPGFLVFGPDALNEQAIGFSGHWGDLIVDNG